MSRDILETVECGSQEGAQWSVIWLHGLGADGHDFEPVIPMLGLPPRGVRFVFPHAPFRPITLNGGMSLRGWFDILGLDKDSPQDEAGLRESEACVRDLIARENKRGLPCERIFLAGFSQGGAMTLQCGLRYPETLAGLICLSCFLPLASTLAEERSPANQDTAIFLGHGDHDPLLPVSFGEGARDMLTDLAYDVRWESYPIAHSVCPQELEHVGAWLTDRMGAQ